MLFNSITMKNSFMSFLMFCLLVLLALAGVRSYFNQTVITFCSLDESPLDEPPIAYNYDVEWKETWPIITWWTPFTRYYSEVKKCPRGSCVFTQNRDNPSTNGFMFYGTKLKWKDLPLPRKPYHLWFLLHEESPKNNLILQTKKGISLFNYTATCSRHSSYPLVTQYLESLDWLVDPLPVYTTSQKSKRDIGLVVYLSSDCDAPSDRDAYVQELMKFVKVDSYGKCLHNKDLPENLQDRLKTMMSPDLFKVLSQYKFMIVFENAICEDYITEKLWRTFKVSTVPIYKGSPSVMDWSPDNHSIILADKFSSPKELANYLKYLDGNDKEYERYLDFKTKGIHNQELIDHMKQREWGVNQIGRRRTRPDFIEGFQCYVCDRVYESQSRQKESSGHNSIANIRHYHSYPVQNSFDTNVTSESVSFWQPIYKCAEDQAKVIYSAIESGADTYETSKLIEEAHGCFG